MSHRSQALAEAMMRGADETGGLRFRSVDPGARLPARHPPRKIRRVVNAAAAGLDGALEALCADVRSRRDPAGTSAPGAPCPDPVPGPGGSRWSRCGMTWWFVGLGIDDPVWGDGRVAICPAGRFQP